MSRCPVLASRPAAHSQPLTGHAACRVQILPAVYLFIMRSFKATPSQLGTMTLCRAAMQVYAVSNPL